VAQREQNEEQPRLLLPLSPRPSLPDPLGSLPAALRRLPMLAPRHLQAHREWFKDGAMRLWAGFRARMLAEAEELADEGLLARPEDIWRLTPAQIISLPAEQWRADRASRPSRRGAPAHPALSNLKRAAPVLKYPSVEDLCFSRAVLDRLSSSIPQLGRRGAFKVPRRPPTHGRPSTRGRGLPTPRIGLSTRRGADDN